MFKHTIRGGVLVSFLLCATRVSALPIGFGYNQGKLEFSEITSPDFNVYYDARTPADGRLAFKSLSAARPHMERWFQTSRSSPLIVNMSAESDNASFANFITDSIELQTLGQGSRDLAWHEYTHATMYRRLDNFFGPAGSILHLPWMEAWFLEGLAEAVSVSVGSDPQAGVERYQALHDDWPSWDRIHSLYTSGPFSYRGYATSGAFVAWILRTYDANRLPEILTTFRDDSMPWWWPWALTPFNNFWPMDTMLRHWTGHSGKELYEAYKADATKFWKAQTPAPLLVAPGQSYLAITSSGSVQRKNGKLFAATDDNGTLTLKALESSDQKPTMNQWSKEQLDIAPSTDAWSNNAVVDGNARLFVGDHWPHANQRRASVIYAEGTKRRTLKRNANWISQIFLTKDDLWWIEYELESSRLCGTHRGLKTAPVKCILTRKTPINLSFLGTSSDVAGADLPSSLWIEQSTQTMLGDRHELLEISLKTTKIASQPWTHGGKPISFAQTGNGRWLIVSDRSRRYVRHYADDGRCTASALISDMPVRLINSNTEYPSVVVWMGESYAVTTLSAANMKQDSCTALDDHTSPLLFAIRSGSTPDFKTAVNGSSIWQIPTKDANPKAPDPAATALTATESTNGTNKDPEILESAAHWRARPIFMFPWIGADDALGPQIGFISVPLMDHQQNETIRATFLLGIASRFPYQELALTENRFTPTWTIAPYRSQLYNGRYFDTETEQIFSSYLDEKGVHIDGDLEQSWKNLSLAWTWGARGGNLAKYIGKANHVGNYREVYAGASMGWRMFGRWRLLAGAQTRIAPKSINKNFDYNVVGVSSSITHPIGNGSFDLGIEGERTRGPYRRDLQEMYTPLKTFIPGSGGGYNKNSYAITNDYGLFSPLFGESQGRAKLNFTHPVIADLDKFTGLIYLSRLDFSAFLNHGTAWSGDKLPEKSAFLTAHGYNLDLLMDNKGVRFNCGMGIGQVVGNKWQSYATAGFDALF